MPLLFLFSLFHNLVRDFLSDSDLFLLHSFVAFNTIFSFLFLFQTLIDLGNSRLGICAQSAAATAAEAHDSPASARCDAHSKSVAVLRRRRELNVHCHLEDSPSALT